MSNSIIPPLLSDSPPPIATNIDEDYDDEFGDFTGPEELSFDNDLSIPSTPKNSKHFVENYSPFEQNKKEYNYERNMKKDDESTENFNINELPTKNYINILDHIENNAPKIVNRDKEDILKVNSEVEYKFKDSFSVKELDQSQCEETKKDNFLKNGVSTKLFEEIKQNVSGELLDANISHNDSTKESESISSSEEDELREKLDVTNHDQSEVPSENISAIIEEVWHDSNDYFGDSSINNDDNKEFGGKKEKSSTEDDLKQIKYQSDDSIHKLNGEKNLFQNLSRDIDCEIETLKQENDDNTEKDNKVNEFSDCIETSHNLNKEDEGIHFENTIKVKSDEAELTHEISPSNLKETEIKHLQLDDCKAAENIEDDEDFGEFADFKTSKFDSNTNVLDFHFEAEDVKQVKDDFAQFENIERFDHTSELKNFKSSQKDLHKTKLEQGEIVDNQLDEFDDFSDYSTFSKPKDETDDDFDHFCDYSTFSRQNSENKEMSENNVKICKGPEEAFQLSQVILEDMFLSSNSDLADYINSDITLGNSVFENLKDITETNALMYQWEKSAAQKNILKTLNIDIRNILYGPTWHGGVPIFAANLCSTPLEPIKSEVNHSFSAQKSLESTEADRSGLSTDVPLAEFDWNGAGLTNPLDYSPSMLLDLGELMVDCSTIAPQDWEQSDSPSVFDDWETLGLSFENVEKQPELSELSKTSDEVRSSSVNSISSKLTEQKDNTSVKSLQIPQCTNETPNVMEIEQNATNEDDFSDFASCQPNYEQHVEWTGKMLPLRESHISYQPSSITEESLTSQAIFKPSIQNSTSDTKFDFSFLESKSDNATISETSPVTSSTIPVVYGDLKMFSLSENKLGVVELPNANFDDFRSFETESNPSKHYNLHSSELKTNALPVNISVETSDIFLHNTEVISKIIGTVPKKADSDETSSKDFNYQEDEFTDFHSSSPNQPKLPPVSALSFPEPLKPAVLLPVSLSKQSAAKIDWPEPGLDEDEISRIVAGCLRRKSESETRIVGKKESKARMEENTGSKSTIGHPKDVFRNDDDEWTDFVSVKEPVKSRTATPDLPLSVFNLGSVQPKKAPTPVVTPNGLICSPSKNPLPNMYVPKSNINTQRNMQNHPHKHPFITSQAFDALYQNPRRNITLVNNSFSELPRHVTNQLCGNFDKTSPSVSNIGYVPTQNQAISYGQFQSSSFSVPKSSGDDDEWGDFVSASNGVTPNLNPIHSATRIITNPSHFMGSFNKNLPSEQYSSSNRGTVVRQERRNIPSISAMPDLDFVSPRTKGAKK